MLSFYTENIWQHKTWCYLQGHLAKRSHHQSFLESSRCHTSWWFPSSLLLATCHLLGTHCSAARSSYQSYPTDQHLEASHGPSVAGTVYVGATALGLLCYVIPSPFHLVPGAIVSEVLAFCKAMETCSLNMHLRYHKPPTAKSIVEENDLKLQLTSVVGCTG